MTVEAHLFTDYLGQIGLGLIEQCVQQSHEEHVYGVITRLCSRGAKVYSNQVCVRVCVRACACGCVVTLLFVPEVQGEADIDTGPRVLLSFFHH